MNTKRPPIGRPFCLAGYRPAILPFFTPPSTQRFPPVVFQRTSDGALEAASFDSKYVTPFSAPFGGFCLRLRSLCDGGVCGNSGVPFRGRRHARSQAYDAAAMAAGRQRLPPAPRVRVLKTRERRVTLSRHPVCRTDTPGFSGETTGSVRHPVIPLVTGRRPFSAGPSGTGPRPSRTRSADPALLPRLAAYPSAGWGDCRHGFHGRGKWCVKKGRRRGRQPMVRSSAR